VLCLSAAAEELPLIKGGVLPPEQRATFKATFEIVYNSKTLLDIAELEKTFNDEYGKASCKRDTDVDRVSGAYPAKFKSTHTVIYNAKTLPTISELEEHFKLTYKDACSVKTDLEKVADGSMLPLTATFGTNYMISMDTGVISNVSYASAEIGDIYVHQSNITVHVRPNTKVEVIADQ